MKTYLYPCLIGLSILGATTLTYVSFQTHPNHPSREIANLKSKSKQELVYKFSSLEQTVRFIIKNEYSQVEYSGRFIKEDVDFFKEKRHLERYFIENDRERVLVNPVNIEGLEHLVGKEVILTGWNDPQSDKIHGRIELEQKSNPLNKLNVNQEIDVKAIRFEKMLVVMGDFNDSLPLPVGPNLVSADNIGPFLNSKTFQEYFKVIYQGRIKNTVTKVVSYRFNRNCADKIIPGNAGAIGYVDSVDLNVMFSELDLNANDYTNVSVLANCNASTGWGVASGASVDGVYLTTSNLTMHPIYYKYGSPNDLVPYLPNPDDNWTFLDGFIHERLHTFGHPHANGLDCGANKLLFPCVHKEYHNPFDVMGHRYPGYFLNAHHMKRNNIRPESQYLTITKPGIYTINNLESINGNAVIAAYIKIPELSNKVFMVEHRLPVNFDRNLIKPIYKNVVRGLILYSSISPWGNTASFYDNEFRIIDPYPQAPEGIDVPFIERLRYNSVVPEKPFFDPITGVRITVLDNLKQLKKTESPTISFKVDFDVENRMCFKAKVSDIVDPFFIQRNGVDESAETIVDLNPGDIFSIRGRFTQFQNAACPSIQVNTIISNTSLITRWYRPKDWTNEFKAINANAVRPPIGGFEGGYDGGYEGGIEGGQNGEHEEDTSTPTIEGQFASSNMIINVSQEMKIPDYAPAGYYELPVTYKNHTNGDGYTSVIKFRINNPYSKRQK